MRSPRILFLSEADRAMAVEEPEMVGAMKLLGAPTPLERTLCVLAGSRGSFSFSGKQGHGEAQALPFLQAEELLCGESASESPPKSVRDQQIGVENGTS